MKEKPPKQLSKLSIIGLLLLPLIALIILALHFLGLSQDTINRLV